MDRRRARRRRSVALAPDAGAVVCRRAGRELHVHHDAHRDRTGSVRTAALVPPLEVFLPTFFAADFFAAFLVPPVLVELFFAAALPPAFLLDLLATLLADLVVPPREDFEPPRDELALREPDLALLEPPPSPTMFASVPSSPLRFPLFFEPDADLRLFPMLRVVSATGGGASPFAAAI